MTSPTSSRGQTYQKRRAAGRCPECGGLRDSPLLHCTACRLKHYANATAVRPRRPYFRHGTVTPEQLATRKRARQARDRVYAKARLVRLKAARAEKRASLIVPPQVRSEPVILPEAEIRPSEKWWATPDVPKAPARRSPYIAGYVPPRGSVVDWLLNGSTWRVSA